MESGVDERLESWRATTSILILESIQHESRMEANSHNMNFWIHNFSIQVHDVLGPLTHDSYEKISNRLIYIIQAAIVLDQNICTQTSSIHWRFGPSRSHVQFDPDHMELEQAEVASRSDKYVDVVMSPALFKTSKRMGKSSEREYCLLKMAVTCRSSSGGPLR